MSKETYMSGSLRLAWLVVMLALLTAVGFAADLAWHRFTGMMFLICLVGLVTIAIAEVLFWHQAASAWHERRPVAAFLSVIVALACSAGTLYTNYSVSAIGQDAKASEKLTAYNRSDDLAASIKNQQTQVETLQKQIAAAPTRTAAAAEAAIAEAQAHRWWAGVTAQCTKTVGPQTRQFCSAYRQAEADKANAKAATIARAELANAQNELRKLRDKRGTTDSVADSSNPAMALLVSAGLTDRQARVADSMVLPLVIQVIMALGGILLANEHARGKQSKSWLPQWLSLWAKASAYKAATGKNLALDDDGNPVAAEPSKATTLLGIDVETVEQRRARELKEKPHLIAANSG